MELINNIRMRMNVSKNRAIVLGIILSSIVIFASFGFLTNTPPESQPKLFIAIHCEPGSFPATTDYPAQYWLNLRDMIIEADQHGVKLTILFNPQWASYILLESVRLTMVRSWESNGHEIGLHHHGAHMNNWNGYTDQVAYQSDPKYQGSINDMMDIMTQIPLSGTINVACVANEDDIDIDFPIDIPYMTYGGSEKTEHLWSNPENFTYNQHSILGVSHARFGVPSSEVNIDLNEFEVFLAQSHSELAMGLVWHVFNYADTAEAFTSLFEYLSEQNIETSTVTDIIESI